MRQLVRTTAIGYVLPVVPSLCPLCDKVFFDVVFVNRHGNWSGSRRAASMADAKKLRTRLFKHHAKLQRQRDARKALKKKP